MIGVKIHVSTPNWKHHISIWAVKGFDAICKGEYDHLPEAAFYMVGTIEEAVQKAESLANEAAA